MPMPAGTGLTRRSFVSRATGLALSVYGAASLGPKAFEEGIAAAAAQAPSERILVSVFLSGGADSLTMLAPTGAHPQYAASRPTLALPDGQGTPFTEDSSLRWHPSFGGLAELYGEGKVTVMPAIGYADANQSHFTSRHYWEVGETNPFGRWGWLGRYLDQHGVADNPLQGLALGWDLQPVLAARDVPVATVGEPDNYDFWTPGVWGPVQDKMLDAFGDLGELSTSDAGPRPGARGGGGHRPPARPARALPGRLHEPAGVTYPGGSFAGRLRALAAMVDGGLPLKVVAIESGGYDTHSNQAGSLPADLLEIGNSLRSFQRDLEARGLAGPRARARVERVRPPAGRERLGHGPRRGRGGLRDRLAGTRRDGRRVPRPRDARRRRQPAQHLRFPRRLLLAARAVARRGRRADHPERLVVRAPGAGRGLMRLRLVALAALLAALTLPGAATARTSAPVGKAGYRAAHKVCKQRARCAVIRHRRKPAARTAASSDCSVSGRAPRSIRDPGRRPARSSRAPGARHSAPPPRFVSVAAREFSLTLSRPLVGAGTVLVELRNSGEDPHNLVVSPEGTHDPLASFSEIDPGTYERRSVTLAPGRYQLWCSLEFHEGLGMSTTLRVQ